jgi:EAL domain-containing protein (putative c-di-GMP-specific phosphodiesterase class I)
VAEGVETKEVAQQLRDLGCDKGQGWYFGHPVPAEELLLS